MPVGDNIRRRRTQLRMSQQELADAMGYKTRSTIAKIESGENDVSQSKLRKFAAVLDTTVEMLIAGEDRPAAPAAPLPELFAPGRRRNVAVILAGGSSCRNRQNIPGQFVNVHGKPILVYSMEEYQAHPAIDDIYVVALRGWESIVSAYAAQYGIRKLRGIVPGGESGIASLRNAVELIRDRCAMEDLIFIQESTRPLVRPETISRLLLACGETGSATICHSMNEYVQFQVEGDRASYLDRNAILALQSPEAHRLSLILQVLEKADALQQPLQDSCFAMLMHRLGFRIHFVECPVNNIKISRDEDIAAFSVLTTRR